VLSFCYTLEVRERGGGERMKKDVVLAVLITFCLTVTLFSLVPSKSATGDYDPWADINDDGKINMYDIGYTARLFGTTGTAINKTELLLGLQAQIDSLNASLIDLINQTKNIYAVEIKAYCPIENKDLSVEIMKNGILSGYNTTHEFILMGDNTFTVPLIGPNNHRFTHWNTGSTNTTIAGSSGVYTAYYEPPALDWFNGLVGYWRFDEGNGTVAGDSSGNSNNGTLENGPLWIDGKHGTALRFDGLDDYVKVPDNSTFHVTSGLTLEVWVKVSGSTGDHQVVLTKWYPDVNGYTLELQPDGLTPQFVVIASGCVTLVSSIKISFDSWTHIVGTYDGATVKIYVNGSLTGSQETTGNIVTSNQLLCIGSHSPSNPGDRNWFKGTIDNVMIYNRALSEEEVLAHYILPPP
jgi:hypothetical protein